MKLVLCDFIDMCNLKLNLGIGWWLEDIRVCCDGGSVGI